MELKQLSVEDIRQYASAARELIENPVVDYVFTKLSDSYLTEFVGSDPQEKDRREAAYYKVNALQDLKAELVGLVIAGEQEAIQEQEKMYD